MSKLANLLSIYSSSSSFNNLKVSLSLNVMNYCILKESVNGKVRP